MTSESKSSTEPWVESKGAKYAYAYDKGGKLSRYFGVKGIPHAILVDATGTVVWRGHPGGLSDSIVEQNLGGALATPVYEWPSSAKNVRKALGKKDYAKALGEVAKLEDDAAKEIEAAIRGLVKGRVDNLVAALEAGNYYDVSEWSDELSDQLEGLPEADKVAEVAAKLETIEVASEIIKVQKRIRKLKDSEPRKRKEIEKAIGDMRKVMAEYPDTYAAKEASDYLVALQKS